MDSHPKKKKKITEQIRNQTTVTSLAEIKTVYTLYKAKANQTPLPNTAIQRRLSKKERNQIQSKKETPNPEQTKPTVAPPLLAGAARSVTSAAPRLVVVARLPPSSLVAGPSSQIRTVSPSQLFRRRRLPVASRPQGISPPFSL